MEELVSLAPQVGAVTRIFSSLFHYQGMSKEDVTLLYGFLQTAPALIDIERMIGSIVVSAADAGSNPILNSVARDLDAITRASLSSLISSLDPYFLWERELR